MHTLSPTRVHSQWLVVERYALCDRKSQQITVNNYLYMRMYVLRIKYGYHLHGPSSQRTRYFSRATPCRILQRSANKAFSPVQRMR